jgi:hypothetical protein
MVAANLKAKWLWAAKPRMVERTRTMNTDSSNDEERLRCQSLEEVDSLALWLDTKIDELELAGLSQGLNEFRETRRSASELRKLVEASRSPTEHQTVVETLRWLCEWLDNCQANEDVRD